MRSAWLFPKLNLGTTAVLLWAMSNPAVFAQNMTVEVRSNALESVVQIYAYDWENDLVFGKGSGTVISALGHVLTNHHVVVDNEGNPLEILTIFTADAKTPTEGAQFTYLAVPVALDAGLDLALLRIVGDTEWNVLPEDHEFTFAPIGTIEGLLLGDSVFVIGFPGMSGDTTTLTGGVVSGFLGSDPQAGAAWMKTDARIAPGNSGGGAFDAAGTLIGVPTLLLPDEEILGLYQELLRPVNHAYAMISQNVPNAALQIGPRPLQQASASQDALAKSQDGLIRSSLGMADAPYFEGRNAHAYRLSVPQAMNAHIGLKSADFDAYLVILGPDGAVLLEVDDSPDARPNVAEEVRFDVPGTYTAVVTTALPHEAGSYVLTVENHEGPHTITVTKIDLPGNVRADQGNSYSGRWSGRIIDTAGGRGAVVAELVQTGSAIVEGTWEATFAWGTTTGTIMGLIQSEGLFVELYPNDRTACPFSGLAELEGYTIAGAYTAFDCSIPIAGSISLTKRP